MSCSTSLCSCPDETIQNKIPSTYLYFLVTIDYYKNKDLPSVKKFKSGKLRLPNSAPGEDKSKLKCPLTADIIPLYHVPFSCRQIEQGQNVCSDHLLEKKLANQLKLSRVILGKVEYAKRNGKEVFRYKFVSRGMLPNDIFNTSSESKS